MVATTFICLLVSFFFSSIVSAVLPVTVSGSHFYTSDNKEFQIVGVDYQPGGEAGFMPQSGQDPLSDGKACLRDAALMQQLGVNTIRVYNVDPSISHDACSSIFNSVGIYMIVDVNSPFAGQSISRIDPQGSYTSDYLQRVFQVVENFKSLPNLMAFFAGNEIINDNPSGNTTPPYIRAVQRDLKAYIAKHSPREIPVGYSAADVRELLASTWQYLQCAIDGEAESSRSDFFGLNSYSWCGASDPNTSGYTVLDQLFSNSSCPVFFSEYGCNKVTPRIFTEVQAIYGSNMSAVFSGGLVYEYTEETDDYGLVNVAPDGSVKLLTDYDNLRGQYAKLNTAALQSAKAPPTNPPPSCSASLIDYPGFSTNFTIPPSPGGDLIENGVTGGHVGQLVPVTDTVVSQTVTASNGTNLTGLAIRPLPSDQSNTPGGDNTLKPKKKGGAEQGRGQVSIRILCLGIFFTFIAR